MRQVILDTETTGLDPSDGHRVIEIGCIEMVNRRLTDRTFHAYINPEREIEPEAIEVHGITNEFLKDKANFAGVAEEFIEFITVSLACEHRALLNGRRRPARPGPSSDRQALSFGAANGDRDGRSARQRVPAHGARAGSGVRRTRGVGS